MNKNSSDLFTTIASWTHRLSLSVLLTSCFEAKAGQKLSYRTADDICIWLYAPNTQLLKSGDLPITGKYTLQLSALKGSTTFNVEISLGTLSASAPSVSPSPSATSSHSTSVTTSNPPSVTIEASELTQEQELAIVQKWYEAKSRIFAPPFDTSLVNELATGTLLEKTTNSDPERGRIAWLRNNNSYYTYNNTHIDNILRFSNSGAKSYLKIRVPEELYLHSLHGIDRKNSGPYQADFIYFFEKDNENWKISDYSKVS